MKYLMIFILVILGGVLYAQNREKPVSDYLPTENLESRKDANKASNRPDRKRISLIYVETANGILYGNACATSETHRMGFEYIVEPSNGLESRSKTGKFLNNLWVKSKLVLRRSPFWKLTLNNRIRKCRRQTGDFVG